MKRAAAVQSIIYAVMQKIAEFDAAGAGVIYLDALVDVPVLMSLDMVLKNVDADRGRTVDRTDAFIEMSIRRAVSAAAAGLQQSRQDHRLKLAVGVE